MEINKTVRRELPGPDCRIFVYEVAWNNRLSFLED